MNPNLKRKKVRSLLLVRFFFILFVSFLLALYGENVGLSFNRLQILTAKTLAFFMHGSSEGAMVILPQHGLYINIVPDCTGWKTFLALLALWFALPFENTLRLILVLVSFPIAFFINLQRMIFAVYAYSFFGGGYVYWDVWAFRLINLFFILLVAYFIGKEAVLRYIREK